LYSILVDQQLIIILQKKDDDSESSIETKVDLNSIESFFPSFIFQKVVYEIDFLQEILDTIIGSLKNLKDLLTFSSINFGYRHKILSSNQFWKKLYDYFWFGTPVYSNVENVEDFFQLYLKIMKEITQNKYHYGGEECWIGEEDGEYSLTINKFGIVRLDGYSKGCGRGGEDYAHNEIKGKGKLLFTTDIQSFFKNINKPTIGVQFKSKLKPIGSLYVIVDAKETISMGSCEWTTESRSSKNSDDKNSDEDEDDEDENRIPSDHIEFYESSTERVIYFLKSKKFFGEPDRLECLTKNMEW